MNPKQGADLAGVTYRRFDYWLEQGYLGAQYKGRVTGSGNQRPVDQKAVDLARTIHELTSGFEISVPRASLIAHRIYENPRTVFTFGAWSLTRAPEKERLPDA
jgi:DNA-binding transcriptional MerR regulator